MNRISFSGPVSSSLCSSLNFFLKLIALLFVAAFKLFVNCEWSIVNGQL
jgi:hypothetical protein